MAGEGRNFEEVDYLEQGERFEKCHIETEDNRGKLQVC